MLDSDNPYLTFGDRIQAALDATTSPEWPFGKVRKCQNTVTIGPAPIPVRHLFLLYKEKEIRAKELSNFLQTSENVGAYSEVEYGAAMGMAAKAAKITYEQIALAFPGVAMDCIALQFLDTWDICKVSLFTGREFKALYLRR